MLGFRPPELKFQILCLYLLTLQVSKYCLLYCQSSTDVYLCTSVIYTCCMCSRYHQIMVILTTQYPCKLCTTAGLMLAHRLRRWTNNKSTLDQRLVFAEMQNKDLWLIITPPPFNAPITSQRYQRVFLI